jgi:hypothetical protein
VRSAAGAVVYQTSAASRRSSASSRAT